MTERDHLDRAPDQFRRQYRQAVAELRRRHHENAARLLEPIVSQRPTFAPAHNRLGVASVRGGDRRQAEERFHEALAADPKFAPALTNLANLAFEAGDEEAARSLYERAIAADPRHGPAYHNLAALHRRAGRTTAAVRSLRKARRLRGLSPETSGERVFYREPGCLVPAALLALLGLVYLLVLVL